MLLLPDDSKIGAAAVTRLLFSGCMSISRSPVGADPDIRTVLEDVETACQPPSILKTTDAY